MMTTAIENCPEGVEGFLEQEGTDSAQIVVDHHLYRARSAGSSASGRMRHPC
jgi:hypothetical protein